MSRHRETCSGQCSRLRVALTRTLTAAAVSLCAMIFAASPVAAGDLLALAKSMPPSCQFRVEPASASRPQSLSARCNGHGLALGPASEFQTFRNDQLNATLVDIQKDDTRRIMLIRFHGDQPSAEDLSGEIALAAGRGPLSQLTGVEIELAGFAADGRIGVAKSTQYGQPPTTVMVDLGRELATR